MVVLQPIKGGCHRRVPFLLKRDRARRALSSLGTNNTRENLQLAQSLMTISAEEFARKWNFDPIQGVPLPSGRFQWAPLTSAPNDVTSNDLSSSTSAEVNLAQDNSEEKKTCVTLPPSEVKADQSSDLDLEKDKKSSEIDTVNTEVSASHNCCPRTCLSNCALNSTMQQGGEKDSTRRDTAADSGIDSDDSVIEDTEMVTTGTSSSAKTDDCQQSSKLRQTCITDFVRPKKLATFRAPEALQNSPSYPKKRPASGLPDQLGQPPHKKLLLHLRA